MAVLKYQPPELEAQGGRIRPGNCRVHDRGDDQVLIFFSMLIESPRDYDLEVMSGLSRQGSNLASRGTDLSDAVVP